MALRWISGALALALAPVFTAAAQSPAIRVPYVVDSLPNGLQFVIHEDHSVPIVTVNTWRRVGSADEKPGRTGFAHLFEHLMFMGSAHAPYPMFDRLLEAAGADNNASTNDDYTNYYESGPSNATALMLWLEADRTGAFLETMDDAKLDLQRDVVKNERRQSYENRPYGLANETIDAMLYPKGHPYSWPVIGSMADLSAASLDDVKDFFRRFYAPNNTTVVVAGDVKPAEVRTLIARYFGPIPRVAREASRTPAPFALAHDTAAVLEDQVQLPRLYYLWHTVKAFAPDDAPLQILAYILTGAKNSRLTQQLVYTNPLATDVEAYPAALRLDGAFYLTATARPGKTLADLQTVVDRELQRLALEGPSVRELDQAKNATEATFLSSIETVSAKADQLNRYFYFAGTPGYFAKDLARYRAVTAADVQRVVRTYLLAPKAILSVVPQGKRELAATVKEVTP